MPQGAPRQQEVAILNRQDEALARVADMAKNHTQRPLVLRIQTGGDRHENLLAWAAALLQRTEGLTKTHPIVFSHFEGDAGDAQRWIHLFPLTMFGIDRSYADVLRDDDGRRDWIRGIPWSFIGMESLTPTLPSGNDAFNDPSDLQDIAMALSRATDGEAIRSIHAETARATALVYNLYDVRPDFHQELRHGFQPQFQKPDRADFLDAISVAGGPDDWIHPDVIANVPFPPGLQTLAPRRQPDQAAPTRKISRRQIPLPPGHYNRIIAGP